MENVWHVWKDNKILYTGNGRMVAKFYHDNGGKKAGLSMICFPITVMKYHL